MRRLWPRRQGRTTWFGRVASWLSFGLPQERPTPFMVDAKNVLTLVQNLISSKQTRHITRRELIVREREIEGHLEVQKVHTSANLWQICSRRFSIAILSLRFGAAS